MNTKRKNYDITSKGSSFYFRKGFINLILVFSGKFLFNVFLRDKDVIPVWSFWVGFIYFALIYFLAIFYIAKAMLSDLP